MSHAPLSATDLVPQPLQRLGRRVYVHSTLDSTNRYLLEHAVQAGDGAVAWAEWQTAGRGRLGRRWEAPRGSSILLSVLLHEPPETLLRTHAALLAAVAACEAIEAHTDLEPAVRWPNDLVVGGRKLGGVLAESCLLTAEQTEGARLALVIGIGINCLQQPGHFAGDLAARATSLECESRHPIHRAAVASGLLRRLDAWLALLAAEPKTWERLRAAWQEKCDDWGRRVTLAQGGQRLTGTALEIAPDGDLVVQLEHGGRRHFAAASTTRSWAD
jgi:BirA family biotin operon repressor/biotin-[acetyl-CoA-carboxylase] ligase